MWAGSLHLSSALRRIWPMLSVCLNRTPYPSQVKYCKLRSRSRGRTHFQPSLVHSVVWLGLGNVASNCNKRRYHFTTGKQTRNAQLTQPFGSDLLGLWSLPMAPEPPPSCTFLQLHCKRWRRATIALHLSMVWENTRCHSALRISSNDRRSIA